MTLFFYDLSGKKLGHLLEAKNAPHVGDSVIIKAGKFRVHDVLWDFSQEPGSIGNGSLDVTVTLAG